MSAPILGIFDSGVDIGIVLLVVLLLFGGTQLPKLARSLGSAQKEFKKGLEEGAQGGAAGSDAGSAKKGALTESKGGTAQGLLSEVKDISNHPAG